MGQVIPDEAVEAALAAWADRKVVFPRDVARHMLEAAAPHMMGECEAEALEDAADAFPSYGPERVPVDAITWLQERAAMIRKGIHP